MRTIRKLILLLAIASSVLATATGCAPAQPTAVPTRAPTAAPTAVPPTAAPPPSKPLIMGSWAESPNLNPYYQSGPEASTWMVVEGLLSISPDGSYMPQLAAEVPSVENGGVSADGKVITYKLKEGLTWSDGEPVTSADIRFTWQAVLNPANSVVKTLGHENIASVDTPDPLTAVVTLKEPYVPFLTLFPAVLPEHILGELDSLDNSEYNRQPVGTGPYRVVTWVSGSHIEYEKNPYYREAGKPLLDTVVMKWLPSREAGLAQLVTGEIDILEDITVAELSTLASDPNIQIVSLPSLSSERLFLNLSDSGDLSTPHPILGDAKVREALDYAIDRNTLIQGLLEGQATPATCDLPAGAFGDPTIPSTPYDQEKAKALLDEAGWEVGADGIRAKGGQRLSLRISTTAGNKVRELTEQLLQEQFGDIGVELVLDNKPSSEFWASPSEGGQRHTGAFDILLYTTGPGVTGAFIDPHAHMLSYYHPLNIPSEATELKGGNYMRYGNAVVDSALDRAGSVPDVAERQAAYSEAMRQIAKDKPVLFIYNRLQIHAFRKEVGGWVENRWLSQIPNWDIQNWTKQ